jgi:SagB-type dehydrogenase family enzyme
MNASNWDVELARRFHERTKHTFASVRRSGQELDWDNRPSPFKDYLRLEALPLPEDDVGRLLRWGAGVIRTRRYGPDEYSFRTYSSAGALYPVEVYVAKADGLWHFHPGELALRQLRDVDVRSWLGEGDAFFVLTGTLWRTAWKYGERGYRHLFWDAGTMLANLIALAASTALEPRVETGFVDAHIDHLVGADGEREAGLALLALGEGKAPPLGEELPALALAAAPLSPRERSYPEAHAFHTASGLADGDAVSRYRADGPPMRAEPWAEGLEPVLRRRGSVRDFALEAIALSDLVAVLGRAVSPIPVDVPPYAEVFLIVNAVEGLEAGAYRFEPPDRFELLRAGNFRREAGYLALEQPLGARAAATIFLLVDLERVLERHGNRGYRAVQLEGGVRVGWIYLAAFAQGLAATASTFYDDEVTRFFAPGTAKGTLLCAAIGRP